MGLYFAGAHFLDSRNPADNLAERLKRKGCHVQ